MRRELCHVDIVDTEFLAEQGELPLGPVKIGF